MRYLIDGYNLLHATGHLSGKVGPHGLEKARQALLGRLAALVKGGAGVTVVFDARGAPPTVAPDQVRDGVLVRYALDRTADDLIEDLVRHDPTPRSLVVVSDDRRVRDAARRRQCPTRGCLDFYEDMGKGPRPPERETVSKKPTSLSEKDVNDWMKTFGAGDE
jgi:hypothetical protein